jgi:hypothetical protein
MTEGSHSRGVPDRARKNQNHKLVRAPTTPSVRHVCRGHTRAAGVLGPYRIEVPAVRPPARWSGRPPRAAPRACALRATRAPPQVTTNPSPGAWLFVGTYRDFNVFLCETVRARARPTYGLRPTRRINGQRGAERGHSAVTPPDARAPARTRWLAGFLPVLPRCIPAVLPRSRARARAAAGRAHLASHHMAASSARGVAARSGRGRPARQPEPRLPQKHTHDGPLFTPE